MAESFELRSLFDIKQLNDIIVVVEQVQKLIPIQIWSLECYFPNF